MSILQLRFDLWIADHAWQKKHDAVVKTVDVLGDECKPAVRADWLAYIYKTYPDGAAAVVDAMGEDTLPVVHDDD